MLLFSTVFLALDLWSAFSARQRVAAVGDSAAIAGGSALDETAYRSGVLALDPGLAESRSVEAAVRHPVWEADMDVTVAAGPAGVVVTVSRVIPFRYVAVLLPGESAQVAVTGYAEPGEQG